MTEPEQTVIDDRIYGREEINSPALIDLMQLPELQRLKKISQFGVPDEFYHQPGISRWEHSLGVMILLRRLGSSEEEQVAGLLHDVSHTAFSHVIDWVVGSGGEEEYQDSEHARFVANSSIPTALEKFGYDHSRISNLRKFSLLDREKPHLCADRIDYALREFPESTVKGTLTHLRVTDGRIVFDSVPAALEFGDAYLDRQTNHWGSFESTSRHRLLADILKFALSRGAIQFSDFWHDDSYVIQKLQLARSTDIAEALAELRKKSLADLPKSSIVVHKKFRYVDPEVQSNDKIVPLSEISEAFAGKIEEARRINGLGVRLPVSRLPS
ncbi:MAG: HD domain-containing protein [Patescibacteria group bacterium]|nr:HD domain-containing protein [Patescibacteria group bacterium]